MTSMQNMTNTKATVRPVGEDYLVGFFRRLVRLVLASVTSARTKCACTALAIVAVVLLTLGVAGGVECGLLSVYCLLPLCALWPVAALLIHWNRQ